MNNDAKLIYELYCKPNDNMVEEKKKLADKDYDNDGKVETAQEEWMGSRAKAIEKSKMAKKGKSKKDEDAEYCPSRMGKEEAEESSLTSPLLASTKNR